MHKEIIRRKARFATSTGLLSAEQVWDLSKTQLDELAVKLEADFKSSGKKSFLVSKSKKDKLIKLKFDFVLDVLNTKLEEEEVALNAQSKKEKKEEILKALTDLDSQARKNMSREELLAELEGLD